MNESEKALFNRMAYRLAKQAAGDHDRYTDRIARGILKDILHIMPDALDGDVRTKIDTVLEETS